MPASRIWFAYLSQIYHLGGVLGGPKRGHCGCRLRSVATVSELGVGVEEISEAAQGVPALHSRNK